MFKNKIFQIKSEIHFDNLALQIFNYQYNNCDVYQKYCNHINKKPKQVKHKREIPFLPIQFFKSHKVLSSTEKTTQVFTSSGTTGSKRSKHLVTDLQLYDKNFIQIFKSHYGNIENYAILALLPSYMENSSSSLIYMVDNLIQKSQNKDSGFYLHNFTELYHKIKLLESKKQKTILIGVSYALLDFIDNYSMKLNHTIVMETGGMKGRKKEITREELHLQLQKGFGVEYIHSEYGMTELLSQAYSKGLGLFTPPKTMQILIRDPEDPFAIYKEESQKTGGINVIDLANYNSCSFIATQDLGQKVKKNRFKILGRFDFSDIRGCSLLTIN